MPIILLIGRILYGGFFVMNGVRHFKNAKSMAAYAQSKKVPAPKLAIIGSGILIFLGGLGVLLGIFVHASLLLIVLFLIPVTFVMHAFWRDTDPNYRMVNTINFYKNIALLGAALMLLSFPLPWAYAIFS